MAILCPSCKQSITFKDAKPGRYTPKCPKCSQKFLLVVPDDPNQPPLASALAGAAEATGAFIPLSADDPQRTGAFVPSETAGPGTTAAHLAASDRGTRSREPEMTVAHTTAPVVPPPATGPKPTRAATNRPALAGDDTSGFDVAGGAAAATEVINVPDTLGGYRMLKELGKGGMGAVYLARQLSLDRNVAVKVMRPEWAKDPIFVARFTREAFAAAQLVHHNVVQIHDIGAERDVNFFSMEFVEGESLGDIVKREGKLDAEVAVGYTLQAARGLAIAHEQGMVHRDIKPDNLMLNRHGIIKVADLGIVKTPNAAEALRPSSERAEPKRVNPSAPTQVTMAGIAMGTPAYMAPEQARDAAAVDARADIYSLGCTLYVLVTGRPPFEGKTAVEVITKHASQPIVPPEAIVKRVPKALSEIILKMVAKRPEERYQTMPEVIKALETFLGVEAAGAFSPREEHAQTLEESVAAFLAAPAARLRPKLVLAFFAATALLALISLAFSWAWAGGFVGVALLTTAAYFVLAGTSKKSYLFSKVRELFFGSGWKDWLTWIIAGALLVVVLYLLGWLWAWIGGGVLAIALAAGFYYTIDARLASQRREPLETVERMLRSMRLLGLEEDALRQFALCRASSRVP